MSRTSRGRKRMLGAGGRPGEEIEWGEAAPLLAGCCLPVSSAPGQTGGGSWVEVPQKLWERRRVMGGCGGYF